MSETGKEFLSYLKNGDTFEFREVFRYSACRLHVARARFEQAKRIMNESKNSVDMATAKIECQTSEASMYQEEILFGLLKEKLEIDNLDTSYDEEVAGL